MSEIALFDYASLDPATRTRLTAIVATHTSLERVLDWGRAQRPKPQRCGDHRSLR